MGLFTRALALKLSFCLSFFLRCDVKHGQDSKSFELNEFRFDSTHDNGIYSAPFVAKKNWKIGAIVQVECKIIGKKGLTKILKPEEERNRRKLSADEQFKDFDESAWPPDLLINEEEDVGDFARYVTGHPIKVKST